MKLKHMIIGILAMVLALLVVALFVMLFTSQTEAPIEVQQSSFSVEGFDTAGQIGYAVFNYRGDGNVTLIATDASPKRKIIVVNDPQAIEASRFNELVEQLKVLEPYGYSVSVSNTTAIGDAIYVIPTGALPSYALFSLQQNISNGTIIYIGEKDLLLSNGIKRQGWYAPLSPEAKKRLVYYPGTLDAFLDDANHSLVDDILYVRWAQKSNSTMKISGVGSGSMASSMVNATYLHLIYDFQGEVRGTMDSENLSTVGQVLTPTPASIYPWQRAALSFSLNKTNGTAFLSIEKDGKEITNEMLRRVTDENVFLESFHYNESGNYIIKVSDNSGIIASGMFHIKDLKIVPMEHRGYAYLFSVTVDGEPLTDAEAFVSIANSPDKQKFFINDGVLAVNAKLNSGLNVLDVELYGGTTQVEVLNSSDSLLDFYIKYGIPGLAVVFVVYFGARMSRRPTYGLRFGDTATYIREEIKLPIKDSLEAFKQARDDLRIGETPITSQEFGMSLKRHITNGADITEGNVESILKHLVAVGHLENHRNYYQLKGEGDVKRNALRRMIREKLIENGIAFDEIGSKFVTKDYEIGFFGDKFSKKSLVVVDDDIESRKIVDSLTDAERAKLKIKQSNDLIVFVPIDRLSEAL